MQHTTTPRPESRLLPLTVLPATSEPSAWWRVLCRVPGTRIIVTGDLPNHAPLRTEHLRQWAAAGVTDIIDCRIERTDEAEVRADQPHIRYHWVGVDDHGGEQPDEWFAAGVGAALSALSEPDALVLVHCHMGVNRGPSMAFAILLALGWSPADALDAIRTCRPIAGIIYADQALDWWHRANGVAADSAITEWQELEHWMDEHPVDVAWIVHRIWRSDAA